MFFDVDQLTSNVPPGAGAYRGYLEVFGSPRHRLGALVYRFARVGDREPCVCDLVVRDELGALYFRDFVRIPDGRWRDSDGNLHEHLSALFPKEIAELPLDSVVTIEPFEVLV